MHSVNNTPTMLNKSRKLHLIKTLTWRIIASTTTFILAKLFGLAVELALYVALTEFVLKMVLYYFHERIWYNYNFKLNQENIND